MATVIDIRTLDAHAPETVALLRPVHAAVAAHDQVGHPEPTPAYTAVMLTPRADQESAVLAAVDADGVAAAWTRVCRDTGSNKTLSYGTLWSDPARRGQGFEAALLGGLRDWARARGCDRLILDTPGTEFPAALAAAHDGRVAGLEKRSRLDLRAVDRGRLAAWGAPSEANKDYTTVLWSGRTPEDLIESYVRAHNAMNDAPHGEIDLDTTELTVPEIRNRETNILARGMKTYVLAAVAPDGTVAGYTQIFCHPGDFPQASIGSTAVVRAHRGHGLGLRLKAEITSWVLDNLPFVEIIDTWNNEDNAPMLRINTLMGYELAEVWSNVQFGV